MNSTLRKDDQVIVSSEGVKGRVIGVNTDPVSGSVKVRCMLDDGTSWSYPTDRVERTGRHYGYVTGDWTENVYPALIDDQRWNGFAVPLFDKDTTRQIVEEQAANPHLDILEADRLEWSGDQIVMTRGAYPDDPTEVIEPAEDGAYPVGAWVWAWEEVEAPVQGSG